MEVSGFDEAGTVEGSKGLTPGGVKAKFDSVIRQVWSLIHYVETFLFIDCVLSFPFLHIFHKAQVTSDKMARMDITVRFTGYDYVLLG